MKILFSYLQWFINIFKNFQDIIGQIYFWKSKITFLKLIKTFNFYIFQQALTTLHKKYINEKANMPTFHNYIHTYCTLLGAYSVYIAAINT